MFEFRLISLRDIFNWEGSQSTKLLNLLSLLNSRTPRIPAWIDSTM